MRPGGSKRANHLPPPGRCTVRRLLMANPLRSGDAKLEVSWERDSSAASLSSIAPRTRSVDGRSIDVQQDSYGGCGGFIEPGHARLGCAQRARWSALAHSGQLRAT